MSWKLYRVGNGREGDSPVSEALADGGQGFASGDDSSAHGPGAPAVHKSRHWADHLESEAPVRSAPDRCREDDLGVGVSIERQDILAPRFDLRPLGVTLVFGDILRLAQ